MEATPQAAQSKIRPPRGGTRWLVPATAVTGLVLVAVGVALLTPRGESPLAEDGRGGPAEAPITRSLAGSGDLPLTRDGSSVRRTDEYLPTNELGPVFRPEIGPVEMTIGRNQTFYEALAARGVAHDDIMTIVEVSREFRDLRKVRAGETFRIETTADGGLESLGYDLDLESHVTWTRDGDTYARVDGTYPVERILKGVSGRIDESLYASLQAIDAPLSLAPKMSDIMGWDIDFKRDLRQGDTFRVVYEELWKDGALVRTGEIKALEIVNKGKPHTAFLFTEGDHPHYYDADGRNMQKQLLRAPLNYSRISDGFTNRRFHPVLKKWMPHLGVDYAAPLGTPVRAGGDGVVVEATSKKGNGRYIRVRHTNSEYETFYLHLSGFAKGVRQGTRVNQGQIIGYVGATGYATGPHLDYRVKRNGKFVNPRTLKLPAAAPVPAELAERFAALSVQYREALDGIPVGESVALGPVHVWSPPAWDRDAYAQSLGSVRARPDM
ncbi:peptidoglycan DD-metalloendopeptidase family protein [bacterium]|nr:peptidoglycan DD-metalloendopeptidase family protein [bacterium]